MIGFKQVAKIMCDNEFLKGETPYCCMADETFEQPLGFPDFETKAKEFFVKKGWQLAPIMLCDYCAAGRPHDED